MITESGFKSLLQIIISNLELKHFLPRWTGITQACQLNVKYGGIPYSEDSAAWLSTIMFYAALPFLLHLLLNTVALAFLLDTDELLFCGPTTAVS